MKKLSLVIFLSTLILSACTKKVIVLPPTPTPVPREYALTDADKPQITLTPRSDGHELTLKISGLKSIFTKVEYELIYTASDGGQEFEKGVSGIADTKDIVSGAFERKLLLGTESCTNGCKYKYDAGVNGGTLNLTLLTADSQVASVSQSFTLSNLKSKGFTITWTQ